MYSVVNCTISVIGFLSPNSYLIVFTKLFFSSTSRKEPELFSRVAVNFSWINSKAAKTFELAVFLNSFYATSSVWAPLIDSSLSLIVANYFLTETKLSVSPAI